MKHIIIILKDITESGGGERVCVNLANAFTEVGHKVEIISFFFSNKSPAYTLNSSVKVRYLSNISPNKNPIIKLFCKSLYRAFLSKKTDKIIQDSNPQIVLANDGWYIPKKARTKKEKLAKEHKEGIDTKYMRLWHLKAPKKIDKRKQKIFSLFDTLVVLSKRELKTWQSYHHNIRVIPNFLSSLQTTDLLTTDAKNREKVVLSVGRLSGEKGFLRLIDIWEKVKQSKKSKEWILAMVGDGIMKEEIKSKIKAKSMQDSIILKPFTKNIESEYLNASICAMSSHFEGFSMVLLEACSHALPCVSFDIATGPSDIIESGVSGYLAEDGDLQGFADRILELMDSKEKREVMGKLAKERVSKNFSKEAVMGLWDEAFRS